MKNNFWNHAIIILLGFCISLHQCAKHNPNNSDDNTPPVLAFAQPLPQDDTVLIDELYSGSIGCAGDSSVGNSTLFFKGTPEGFTYNVISGKFNWIADKTLFSTGEGPFVIIAGLTDFKDTIYHTWTLHLKKRSWELMSCCDTMLEIAAYDSNIVFKMSENKDSAVDGIGYYSGYLTRSIDGGRNWENTRIFSIVMKRIFHDDFYSFEGIRQLKVFNNSVFCVFHQMSGNTGAPQFEAWNLISVGIEDGPLASPRKYKFSSANESYDYYVSPANKVYQLASAVSQTLTFAAAKILCDTTEEIRLQQSIGYCINGSNKNETVYADFYRFGLFKKTAGQSAWENTSAMVFYKLEVASADADTLYGIGADSSFYVAVKINAVTTLTPVKITSLDKLLDIRMVNGTTGWALTASGEVYFTNNMFVTAIKEEMMRDGSEVKIVALVKAFRDSRMFAVGANKELFRF